MSPFAFCCTKSRLGAACLGVLHSEPLPPHTRTHPLRNPGDSLLPAWVNAALICRMVRHRLEQSTVAHRVECARCMFRLHVSSHLACNAALCSTRSGPS